MVGHLQYITCLFHGRAYTVYNLSHSMVGVSTTVKACFQESLVQILSPRRRVDVLREVMLSKQQKKKPYVITFCGVNGVGKSTNLAKVTCVL